MVVVCEDELQRARRRQAGGADEDEGGVHAAIYQVSDFTSTLLPPKHCLFPLQSPVQSLYVPQSRITPPARRTW
jgi:hypothetical protein